MAAPRGGRSRTAESEFPRPRGADSSRSSIGRTTSTRSRRKARGWACTWSASSSNGLLARSGASPRKARARRSSSRSQSAGETDGNNGEEGPAGRRRSIPAAGLRGQPAAARPGGDDRGRWRGRAATRPERAAGSHPAGHAHAQAVGPGGAARAPERRSHARTEPLDLVLLDVVMPKLEGFEVLKALKQDDATARIPVIVLSNLGQERDVTQAMALGAIAFLVKAHLSLQDLVDRVDAALATGRT